MFEQAFLEVIAAAAIIVHGGLRVLRRCGRLGQEVMGVGGVALQSKALHLGTLVLMCVVSLIRQRRKLSIAGERRKARAID